MARPRKQIQDTKSGTSKTSTEEKETNEPVPTVYVEGIGEVPYRSEPVSKPEVIESSDAETLDFGDPVGAIETKDYSKDIPDPGPMKLRNNTVNQTIVSRNKTVLEPRPNAAELEETPDIEDEIPKVAKTLSQYNLMLGHAKMTMGEEAYIEVSRKIYDYFMRGQKLDEVKGPWHFNHGDVMVILEGHVDNTQKYFERRTP